MGIRSVLTRLLGDRNKSATTSPVQKANAAWRTIESRVKVLDETYESAMELLDEYDEQPTEERKQKIEQAFRDLRDGWTAIKQEADAAMEYDHELERIRDIASESADTYEDWLREFERRPEYFLQEYHNWDPEDLVTESLKDDP